MAKMRSLMYFIQEALGNSRKNFGTTFGAVVTIFLSLLVIGIFMVGSILVNHVVEGVESEVNIQFFLNDNAAEEDVSEMQVYITNLPDVAGVTYISKEDALERFKEMSTADIIDQLEGNPLPASLLVELKNPEQVKSIAEQIKKHSKFESVAEKPDKPDDSLKFGQQVIDKLFAFANATRLVCLVLVVMLIFVALVFINNTIRLAILARRKEIAIMRLVGASNGFIRGPFVMEGALQALVGAGLAILVVWGLSVKFVPQISSVVSFLQLKYDGSELWLVYVLLLVVGLIIGLFGSAWAMRRYLKV
ncbi:MAG: permease-like cell division protein FtsX [Coriobacteriales bacterium]|jgi:cell division transport system permease protein|nr:permease-like cell division protein FtsX [Coriobacteriales bacterium]